MVGVSLELGKKLGNKRKRLKPSLTELDGKSDSFLAPVQSNNKDVKTNKKLKQAVTDNDGEPRVKKESKGRSSDEKLPILLQSRMRMGDVTKITSEKERLEVDLKTRPVEQELNSKSYANTPIENFGEMILKGYGWKPKSESSSVKGPVISVKSDNFSGSSLKRIIEGEQEKKKTIDPSNEIFEIKPRQGRLGLGALSKPDKEVSQMNKEQIMKLEKDLQYRVVKVEKGKFAGEIGVALEVRETKSEIVVMVAMDPRDIEEASLPTVEIELNCLQPISSSKIESSKTMKALVLRARHEYKKKKKPTKVAN